MAGNAQVDPLTHAALVSGTEVHGWSEDEHTRESLPSAPSTRTQETMDLEASRGPTWAAMLWTLASPWLGETGLGTYRGRMRSARAF